MSGYQTVATLFVYKTDTLGLGISIIYSNTFKACAAGKYTITDACDTVRNDYVSKTHTIGKRIITNTCYIIRYIYTGKTQA